MKFIPVRWGLIEVLFSFNIVFDMGSSASWREWHANCTHYKHVPHGARWWPFLFILDRFMLISSWDLVEDWKRKKRSFSQGFYGIGPGGSINKAPPTTETMIGAGFDRWLFCWNYFCWGQFSFWAVFFFFFNPMLKTALCFFSFQIWEDFGHFNKRARSKTPHVFYSNLWKMRLDPLPGLIELLNGGILSAQSQRFFWLRLLSCSETLVASWVLHWWSSMLPGWKLRSWSVKMTSIIRISML